MLPNPRPFAVLALSVLALALGTGCQTIREKFEAPEPELLYSGTAPGLPVGVLVIDDPKAFDQAVDPLDPDFSGVRPAIPDVSVLRIVGRERADACRDTKLDRVSTSGRTATVYLTERVPAAGCPCPGVSLPPRAWLVAVTGWVTRARREVTDIVVPCDEIEDTEVSAKAEGVVQLLESSWQEPPGGRILTSQDEYKAVLDKLGVGSRAEAVDFSDHRVAVVTGRPRENGCRKTRVVAAQLATTEEAVFTVEEIYPGPGQLCTQVFQPARVFLYRVPSTVTRVRIVTEETKRP